MTTGLFRRLGLVLVVATLLIAACTPGAGPGGKEGAANAVENFYRGKSVRFIIGDPPGSAVGVIFEAASRYLGKYIPGNPTVEIENMPGGAGLVAANYIAGVADPDGLTIAATSAGMVGAGVAHPPEVQFELNQLTWLGNADETTVIFWVRSEFPCQSIEALATCPQEMRFAGLGPTSVGYGVAPALVQEAFDLNMRFIYGYQGAAAAILAVEQNEADGTGGSWQTFRTTRAFEWLNNGEVKILLQMGANNPDLTQRGVPHINDIAPETHKAALSVVDTLILLSRPIIAPPNTPADRADALRNAFQQVWEDAEFVADLERANHPPISPTAGSTVQARITEMYNQPPEVLEEVQRLLGQ